MSYKAVYPRQSEKMSKFSLNVIEKVGEFGFEGIRLKVFPVRG
jgi:hypothetical protein